MANKRLTLIFSQVSHLSKHFAVFPCATICCLLTKCQTFRTTVTRQQCTLSHTHTCTLAHTHSWHMLTSGIISTCSTCTSIDSSDHIATWNGLRVAFPATSLLVFTPCAPSFATVRPASSLLYFFFAIVNGNFAARETFCFLLLSITNSFVIFRLHNRQQQQQTVKRRRTRRAGSAEQTTKWRPVAPCKDKVLPASCGCFVLVFCGLRVPVVGLFIASTCDIMQKCSKHIESSHPHPAPFPSFAQQK